MNFFSYLETTKFKVKNPDQFRKELQMYVEGEDVYLLADVDGFILITRNARHIQFCDDPNIPDSLAHFLHLHLLPGQYVEMTYLHHSSKNTELNTTLVLVGEFGITYKSKHDIFQEMRAEHFPRLMTCLDSFFCRNTQKWVEEDKEYKVLGRLTDEFLIVEVDGHKVNVNKSRFK